MPEHPEEQSTLEGTVSSIIFQNEENGYTILRLDAGEEEMTVVGSMPGVSPGEYLTVRGQWVRHATYGTQFRADVVERRLPQGLKEIFHYLASGAIKGIGKATARQLIETFGEDALRVIEEEPEKLTTLKGISPKRARTISDAFRKQMGMRRLAGIFDGASAPRGAVRPPVPGLRRRGPGGGAGQSLCPGLRGIWGGVLPGGRPWPSLWASPRTTPSGWRPDCSLSSPTTTGTTATPSSPPRSSSPPPGSCWRPPATCWRSGWRPWPIGANWTGRPSPARTPCTSPPCTRRRPTSPTASGEMSQAELLPPDGLDRIIARIQRGAAHHLRPPSSARRWRWPPPGR